MVGGNDRFVPSSQFRTFAWVNSHLPITNIPFVPPFEILTATELDSPADIIGDSASSWSLKSRALEEFMLMLMDTLGVVNVVVGGVEEEEEEEEEGMFTLMV